MALEAYNRKRDFEATPEPRGKVSRSKKGGNGYLIQKHAARRLHYDLRLELGGVLLSWAVTKGPSLVPGDKRLAVQTEDHPLDYGDFEGTIPKGEYGGGTVLLWDRGRWKPLGDPKKALAKGHLEFVIEGEKLGGRWHLVRMTKKPREKRDNWLLIKGDDDFARDEGDFEIVAERPESVKTGRTVEEIAGEAPGWSSETGRIDPPAEELPPMPKKAEAAGWPGFVEPALATLRPSTPAGAKWVHEIKFDGYRVQAHVREGRATLYTRRGHDWTDRFGAAIAGALTQLNAREAILDGEIVVEGASGASDFSLLQVDLGAGRTDRLVLFAFDLLYLDGKDLRPAPLLDRKAALEALLQEAPEVLRYSAHFEENGELVLRHACRLSLEGVVSKDPTAPYRSGRGKDWIKSKCSERQEFVVAGYVPSSISRQAIGSLVLGYHDKGKLVHAGRVGTGFTNQAAADLTARLDENPRYRGSTHDEETARAMGFRGALIPGAFLYGHVTRMAVRAWGMDWLERGWAQVRFRRPVYDGDRLSVERTPFVERNGRLEAEVSILNGTEREIALAGHIGLPAARPKPPSDVLVKPLPDVPPEPELDVVVADRLLSARPRVLKRDVIRQSLVDFGETEEI